MRLACGLQNAVMRVDRGDAAFVSIGEMVEQHSLRWDTIVNPCFIKYCCDWKRIICNICDIQLYINDRTGISAASDHYETEESHAKCGTRPIHNRCWNKCHKTDPNPNPRGQKPFTCIFGPALIGRGTAGANGCPLLHWWPPLRPGTRDTCIFINIRRIEISIVLA